MRIKRGDEWKTAFQTWYSHFKYQVMFFRLLNALASFQSYISKVVAKKLNIFVIAYLDNILIYTKDPAQAHLDAVWWILKKLRKHSPFVNFKKCQFYKNKVYFLKYIVSGKRVQMEDERIKEVKNWPEPKSMRDI